MNRPSKSETRTRISDILGKCVYEALGLKEALESEHGALQSQDNEALNDALLLKGRCVERLQSLEHERARESERCGFDAGPMQMERLTDWCDEDSLLANLWEHLIEIVADCNVLNLTNGSIVRMRRQHTESSLAVLRGGTQEPKTYQSTGGEGAALQQRSLVRA